MIFLFIQACDYCPLAFGRKDKVKRHVSTVHLGERPYRCNFCTHKTSRKDKMRIHLQQVHQSVSGAEHFMIDRAPQPPPRVLPGNNTNRNISDIVGIGTNPLPPPPPAALPTLVVPNTPGGIKPPIVNNSSTITTFANSTVTPAVTLTPVALNPTCLNIPSTTSSSNTIGSVTLTPVNRPNPKSVTLTPVVVQQSTSNSMTNEAQTISTMATTGFVTSHPDTLTELNTAQDNNLVHTTLPNISLPTMPDSSTITMIANSLPGMNLTTSLNNSLSNMLPPAMQQNNLVENSLNLPTSLATSLPTFTFPAGFVTDLANSSSASITSLSTNTNTLANSMIQNLPPTLCTTNPVNHTILTNVLNNVNESTVAHSSNQQQLSNTTQQSIQISHPHGNVLPSNVIPLIVTKIEENAVH